MREQEKLVVANLLNGLAPERVAQDLHLDPGTVQAVFAEAMRRVAEYVLVHCVPFFPCQSLAEARRNRLRILEILAAIERWDAGERDAILALLRGRDVLAEFGLTRGELEPWLERTLDALPHYLTAEEVRLYVRDRRRFVAENRARVAAAVEGFVSFRQPLLYKPIEHQTIQEVAA